MKKNKHIALFNRIASVYALFFNYQVKMYKKILFHYQKKIFQDKNRSYTVLDIGCGTGALAYALHRLNHKVTGLDPSIKMITKAEKLLKDTEIELVNKNMVNEKVFKDNQFDYVFFSFVLHGLKYEERLVLLNEALRVAKKRVIIIDYLKRENIIVDLVEFVEGGDYFNFVAHFDHEIKGLNKNIEIIEYRTANGLYMIDK